MVSGSRLDDTPVGDDEDRRLGDLIEDEDAVQPLDAAIGSDLRETMTRVLGSLTPREERVMRMRSARRATTPVGIGIRQIEAKALRKLQHPSRARVLRTFLDR